MNQSLDLYRSSSLAGATHIDLLIATYDGLAEDLRLAGEAAESGDIAERCRWTHHAMLLLGHLESWLPFLQERALEDTLSRFYVFLRGEMLRLQTGASRGRFLELAMHVCEARAAWQQRRSIPPPQVAQPEILAGEAATDGARLTWSA